jgi:hypothetical protein
LLKLEIKIQAPALRDGPERDKLLLDKFAIWQIGRENNSSAEIEFYPTYALVKERFRQNTVKRCFVPKSVELIGIEPTTSSLQSWRSPS